MKFKPLYAIGDKVFVINWLRRYQTGYRGSPKHFNVNNNIATFDNPTIFYNIPFIIKNLITNPSWKYREKLFSDPIDNFLYLIELKLDFGLGSYFYEIGETGLSKLNNKEYELKIKDIKPINKKTKYKPKFKKNDKVYVIGDYLDKPVRFKIPESYTTYMKPKNKNIQYIIKDLIENPDYGKIIWDAELQSTIPEHSIPENNSYSTDKFYYLIKTKEGTDIYYFQRGETGLSKLHPEKYELNQRKKLELQNKKKWSINDTEKFPKELIRYYYDVNQNVLFGSKIIKGIVKYPYIPKQFTKNGNPICLGVSILYNETGCDLSDKQIINWKDLKEIFPENTFKP